MRVSLRDQFIFRRRRNREALWMASERMAALMMPNYEPSEVADFIEPPWDAGDFAEFKEFRRGRFNKVEFVRRIMARLSRDTYLRPREVSYIGHRVAERVSRMPRQTLEAACRCATVVGMMGGRPTFELGDPRYRKAMEIGARKGMKREEQMLALLKLTENHKENDFERCY